MNLGSFSKQPSERVAVSIVYTDALDDRDGVASIESCVVDQPGGVEAVPVLASTERVRVWISGGVDGARYKVTTTVRTSGGEVFEDEIFCKVREK